MSTLSGIILIGGPKQATEFRPLAMRTPKPLFPIAGSPMIYHHLVALSEFKEKGLNTVYFIGDYISEAFEGFIQEAQSEFGLNIE